MVGRSPVKRLVKDSLRLSIISKRHARGEGDIKVEFKQTEKYELTTEELSRRERRREQNREAARRCRLKKKMNKSGSVKTFRTYSTKNAKLLDEIKVLLLEKSNLEYILEKHVNTNQCIYQPHPQNQHIQDCAHQQHTTSTTTHTADVPASTQLVNRQFSIPSDSFTDLEKLLSDVNVSTLLPFGNYSNQSELAASEQCVTPTPSSAGFQVLTSANNIQENVTFFGDDFVSGYAEMKLGNSVKMENVELTDNDPIIDHRDNHIAHHGNDASLSLPDFGKLLCDNDNILNQNFINTYLNSN